MVPDQSIVVPTWSRLQTLGGLNLLAMPSGTTAECGFIVKFIDGCPGPSTVRWFIAFQNDGTEWEYSCGPACSALVTVTAVDAVNGKGVNASGVDRWIISAELTDPGAAQACLWSGVTDMFDTAVLREIVRMPFHMQVDLQ